MIDSFKLFLYSLLLLTLTNYTAFAQKQFEEGVLTYDVSIDPAGDGEGIAQYKGTYTITVKGKQIRKELLMDNGYQNTMLFTKNGGYILRNLGKKKLAIQMDEKRIDKRRDEHTDFILREDKGTKTIGGIVGEKHTVIYKDGSKLEIYCSPEWIPGEDVFDKFPGIKMLPLSYMHKNDDGTTMSFRLRKLEVKLLENNSFSIPEDYKIMTHAEYEQLNK